MEMKPNNDQPASQEPETPEPGEPKPVSKTWQDYVTKILNFLKEWFIKLRPSYKVAVIIFIAIILILILLAYLGIFGQGVANLMKQLVNKIMEMVGTKKS